MKKITQYYNNTVYDLELKQSNIYDAGLGIFLSINAKPILADTFIGYYEGDWITEDNKRSEYSYYINKHVYIDIDKYNKPYTCMINDAHDSKYKNNIISKIMINDTITRRNYYKYDSNRIVGLFTTSDILPGEELFFDYGDDYW
jgi:hypothetical protein